MHIISWEFCLGTLQTALCSIQLVEGSQRAFFNLDLPIKYAPNPKLHGLKWRHKLSTNHARAKPSQGRSSTVSYNTHNRFSTGQTCIAAFLFPLRLHLNNMHSFTKKSVLSCTNNYSISTLHEQNCCFCISNFK